MKRLSPHVLIVNVFMMIAITATFAQPVADFTADKTNGCSPLVVTFENLSTAALSYEWHTGISTTTLANPTVLYTSPGVYPITLIAIDAQGGRDTLVKSQFISVYASPVADFSVSTAQACVHSAITFADLSQPGSSPITQWTWDFGDGKASSSPTPVHAYTGQGVYPVSLQITDANGCSNSILKQQLVTVNAPETEFFASQTVACGTPLPVTFSPLQAGGLTHEWHFGDGNISTQTAPLHTYTSLGSYDVMHIAEDATGCRDTLTKTSFINIGTNTLNAFASDSIVCTGDSIHFTALAPPGSTVSWDYGDGQTGTGLQTGHVYATSGPYTVEVDISDQGGCQVIRQIPVYAAQSPVAAFGVKDTTVGCEVPFTVEFVNKSIGATKYQWNFYDGAGSSSKNPNPSWTYITADSFPVRLIAISANGCKDHLRVENYIKIFPSEIGFDSDQSGGCAPFQVQFTDTSKSFYPIVNWQWDFGDGTTGTGGSPVHTYSNTGVYDVTLIITNSQGCQDTLTTEGMIEVGTKPTANFIADTLEACAFSEVNFINMSSNATDYVWYFGDGDTAMAVNPSHGFAALGPMDVILVANNQGCKDTLIKPMYIDVLAPLPVIAMSGRYLCKTPETVFFSDLSVNADTWQWTLPDGSTSFDSVVTYQFTQDGAYPITLLVSNLSTGCQVEITDSVYVKPIVAEFSAIPSEGCAPLTVAFTDSSDGAIDWQWDFGLGQTSSLQHSSFKFKSAGYHQVSLTVENYYGCKDTKVMDSIRVTKVIAGITTNSSATGCAPLTIDFLDDTREFGSKSLSWIWEFGDGSVSTLQNPSHTYTQAGTYTVKLTVTNDLGCTSTRIWDTQVQATDPQVGFQLQPVVTCPGAPVTFISTSTGSGLAYQWDLGDGGSSIQANPSHAYADTGSFDVALTITDAYGCVKTVQQPNAVLVSRLEAAFVADTTQAPCPPLAVQFTANDQFPHQGLYFQWDFGNGATGNTATLSHVYTQPGNYDVQLIIGTPNGCRDTLMRQQYINIEGPSASFIYDPGEGCPGTDINFQAVSPDTVTYKWIYGDGGTGNGSSSTHTYHTSGSYLPVLVIEDKKGCTVFSYARDPIEIFTPPVAEFTPTQEAHCDTALVQFQDVSQGTVVNWSWDFGDGSGSALQAPAHGYYQPGYYPVSLTVTDQHGCQDSITVPDVITIHPSPDVLIQGALQDNCSPVSVAIEGSTNGHPAVIQQWEWVSGGQQSTGKTWAPTFVQAGIHSITLTAIDQFGCEGSVTEYLEVYPNPVANFEVDDPESCAPIMLSFSDLSSGPAVAWDWSFGDGGKSQSQNPSYLYQQDGSYGVRLRVENVFGCSDSVFRDTYINLTHPIADFSVNDLSGCPGTIFTFADQSQSNRPLQSWSWDFGDNTQAQGTPVTHRFVQSGQYLVSMIVTDAEGCSDTTTLSQPISIQQDEPAIPMQMDVATVISDSEVRLAYEGYDNRRNDFGDYLVFRSENGYQYQMVDSVASINTTTYVDRFLDTRRQRYWYKVVPRNTCTNQAPWDSIRAHATIQLNTWPGLDEATLMWAPYEGWDHIDRYQIYRVTGYQPTDQIFLGETTGEDSSFVDQDFQCDENYSYRVVAVTGSMQAGSDSSFTDPLHLGPTDPTHTIRATVENNQSILVEWDDPNIEMAEQVAVEKSSGGPFEVIAVQPYFPGAAKVSDAGVAVTQNSYTYRIITIDSCGDATPVGRPGTTILLRASREFSGTRLSWSPYIGWEGGVEGYTIEVFDETTQQFRVVAQVGGNVHQYFDDKTDMDQSTYCYRITAWEYGGYGAISQSNEGCVQPEPYLYLANAFTPNGDGYNDRYQVGTAFVGSVEMEIYNRWGKKVFTSSSQEAVWTGYTQSGEPAPEGVYVINIQATGYNGTMITRSATVTLLR